VRVVQLYLPFQQDKLYIVKEMSSEAIQIEPSQAVTIDVDSDNDIDDDEDIF
jgi:hypothetical protein